MSDKEVEKLVDAIIKEKNIKAHKSLEKLLQTKCAKRIKDTIKE